MQNFEGVFLDWQKERTIEKDIHSWQSKLKKITERTLKIKENFPLNN